MTTTIRRAEPDDARAISEIITEILQEPNPVGFDGPMSPEQVRAWMERQSDDGAMWVVDDGRNILAFAAIDFDSSRPSECTFGSWVRQRNRRQGHATELAEVALEFARERGYSRIRGRLPQDNEAALSYLSSIGAMVPMRNPGARFELPIHEERE